MRILIVTPLLPPESGGPSYYAVGLADALTRAGHSVATIAFREVRQYPSGIRHLLFLYKVLLRGLRADAFLILDTVSVALPAVIAGWTLGKKMIIRTGGDFVWEAYIERTKEKVLLSEFYLPTGGQARNLSRKERLLVWLQKNIVFRFAHTVVFNTAWQRDIWRTPYGIPEEKTAVIENEYRPHSGEHTGGGPFLCAWRPTEFKNIDTLEKAYALARKQNPNVTLEIYKDIPREELHEKMRTARALIIPSLSELGPNMAMEALSVGLPVLLTRDCGVHDRMDNVAVWIDPKNPTHIAERMCECMDDAWYRELKKRLDASAYTHSYDEMGREFLDLLV